MTEYQIRSRALWSAVTRLSIALLTVGFTKVFLLGGEVNTVIAQILFILVLYSFFDFGVRLVIVLITMANMD